MSGKMVVDYEGSKLDAPLVYEHFHCPAWAAALENSQMVKLAQGRAIVHLGKTYVVCGNCLQIVRADKPLLGSAHFCD